MHKGIILLVKANNKTETLHKAKEFLDRYKDDVWDWYMVGGRWSQTLSPMYKEFMEEAKSFIIPNEHGFTTQSTIDSLQTQFIELWESLGGEGNHPYSDHYSLPEEGEIFDIVPLSNCTTIVQEWNQTLDDAKKAEMEAKDWLQKEKEDGTKYDNWYMYGYCLQKASNLYKQNFSFDTNVFNIKECNYSIPEDIENYFAIMIDIHN